jgi:hypothetical protein
MITAIATTALIVFVFSFMALIFIFYVLFSDGTL